MMFPLLANRLSCQRSALRGILEIFFVDSKYYAKYYCFTIYFETANEMDYGS